MRRKNPLLTLSGVVFTLGFLLVLGWSLWARGGLAFNPGPLTAVNSSGTELNGYFSHAEFESECSLCHQPLTSEQAVLCLDCHNTVNDQISAEGGLHGRLSTRTASVSIWPCYDCHSDHLGRDYSPAMAALEDFNHSITDFSLIHHQTFYDGSPMACAACHDFDLGSEEVIDQKCFTCHAVEKPIFMTSHADDFGRLCIGCHDGVDRMAEFDHNQTDFPLIGEHIQVQCTSCHHANQKGDRFVGTATRCADCHEEPQIHIGLFSQECQECHSPDAWTPALLEGSSFDHVSQTGFSLIRHQVNYDGSPLACSSCHITDLGSFSAGICTDCHRGHDAPFMESHLGHFGASCMECHDGVDRMSDFDHNRFFVLDGRHAEIVCQTCHGAPPEPAVFAGTPTACAECHSEPEIHAGAFGLECQNCHRTDAWTPALLQNHTFPLDHGGEGLVSCQECHPSTYVEYTCYSCHEHDPQETLSEHLEEGISAEELPNCTRCHPTGREDEAEERGDD